MIYTNFRSHFSVTFILIFWTTKMTVENEKMSMGHIAVSTCRGSVLYQTSKLMATMSRSVGSFYANYHFLPSTLRHRHSKFRISLAFSRHLSTMKVVNLNLMYVFHPAWNNVLFSMHERQPTWTTIRIQDTISSWIMLRSETHNLAHQTETRAQNSPSWSPSLPYLCMIGFGISTENSNPSKVLCEYTNYCNTVSWWKTLLLN